MNNTPLPNDGNEKPEYIVAINPADFVGKSAREIAAALLGATIDTSGTKARQFFREIQNDGSDTAFVGVASKQIGTKSTSQSEFIQSAILLVEALEGVAQNGTIPTDTQKQTLQDAADTIARHMETKKHYRNIGMSFFKAINSGNDGDQDIAESPDEKEERAMARLFEAVSEALQNPSDKLPPVGDVNRQDMITALEQDDARDAAVAKIVMPMLGLIRQALGLNRAEGRNRKPDSE